MSDTEEPGQLVRERLAQARSLERGPEQLALLEDAVRIADAHGDVALGFQARTQLVEAAAFSGAPEKEIVAFTWLLAQSDRDPERFPESRLLWSYKWSANNLRSFPQVSRAQFDATIADMTHRFERHGYSLRPVHKIRCEFELSAGDRKAARSWYDKWIAAPRDGMSDCHACDENVQVVYLASDERDEEALERAAPILGGRLRCAEIPHLTLGNVLRPLLRLGRVAEAARHHTKGLRLIGRNPDFIGTAGQHVEFLTLTGNLSRAKTLVERWLPVALESHDLRERFGLLLAARLLVARAKRVRKWRVPAPAAEDFAGWLDHELAALADRFDARNGTEHYRARIAANLDFAKLATEFPLGEPAKDE